MKMGSYPNPHALEPWLICTQVNENFFFFWENSDVVGEGGIQDLSNPHFGLIRSLLSKQNWTVIELLIINI